MKKKQNGFSSLLLVIVVVVIGLIGTVGWKVLRNKSVGNNSPYSAGSTTTSTPEKVTPQDPTVDTDSDSYAKNQSNSPGIFINDKIGLKFTFPKEWKLINESNHLGVLFRLRSSDFRTTSVDNEPFAYAGTQITFSVMNSTFAKDRKWLDDPGNNLPIRQIKDLTINGRTAFSYSTDAYETAVQSNTVEIDMKDKKPIQFILQPVDAKRQFDETSKPVFDSILNSIEYL